jgi:predicted nucleic acid-binding protein
VDASLAAMWLIPERFTPLALEIRRVWASNAIEMIAPPIFRPEMTSVIRKAVHLRFISADDGTVALQKTLNWPILITQDSNDLQRQAYDLATTFKRPRAYDAQYLAVAQMIGCEFWTADERLINSLQGKLPWVRWIGDYQPP